jgi:hypothetical protein
MRTSGGRRITRAPRQRTPVLLDFRHRKLRVNGMNVFDRISGQLDAVRLPLFAVTLTAVPRANTPVLLMLHWHGFRPADAGAVKRRTLAPVAGSALQINEGWQELGALDEAMLDAAWRLGAWELDREERRACTTAGASERESLECRQAFGETAGGEAALVADAPDREDLLALGAAVGYVRWLFRPVLGGLWRQTAEDDTLTAEGGRPSPCPVAPRSPAGPGAPRTRYRLGAVRALIVP